MDENPFWHVGSGQSMVLIRINTETLEPLKHKEKEASFEVSSLGEPGGIRTHDLLIRSQTLYPAELRAHALLNHFKGSFVIIANLS